METYNVTLEAVGIRKWFFNVEDRMVNNGNGVKNGSRTALICGFADDHTFSLKMQYEHWFGEGHLFIRRLKGQFSH